MIRRAHNKHGRDKNAHRVSVKKSEGKNHLKDLGVDGRITFKCMLKKFGGRMWTEYIWFRIGCCEYGNEHSVSIKNRNILTS
jgi:hypothetical protein